MFHPARDLIARFLCRGFLYHRRVCEKVPVDTGVFFNLTLFVSVLTVLFFDFNPRLLYSRQFVEFDGGFREDSRLAHVLD